MATGTPTLERIAGTGLSSEVVRVVQITPVSPTHRGPAVFDVGDVLDFGDTEGQELWDQVGRLLRRPVPAGRASTSVPDPHGPNQGDRASWRTVAPGVRVPEDEYQRRFGGIDLERFRQVM